MYCEAARWSAFSIRLFWKTTGWGALTIASRVRRGSPRSAAEHAGTRSRIADRLRHFGKRDILLVVTGDEREAQRLPILLRFIDPLARRGNEVPEHVPRSAERLSTHEHRARSACARQARFVPWLQHVQSEQLEWIAVEFGVARHQHHSAFVGLGVDRQRASGTEPDIG